jgi:hypothetical protein
VPSAALPPGKYHLQPGVSASVLLPAISGKSLNNNRACEALLRIGMSL